MRVSKADFLVSARHGGYCFTFDTNEYAIWFLGWPDAPAASTLLRKVLEALDKDNEQG